jgi:hypothetical protein
MDASQFTVFRRGALVGAKRYGRLGEKRSSKVTIDERSADRKIELPT